MTKSAPESTRPARRSSAIAGAMLIGLPLAFGVLMAVQTGLVQHPLLVRYLAHPAEKMAFLLFGAALGTLAIKLSQVRKEKKAFGRLPLPAHTGNPVPPTEAGPLLAGLRALPRWLRGTLLGRRIEGLLDFVHQRGSAEDLDDQMRALADTDAMALEGSYGLTRFITWAMPILGFLGTVLGITQAISGITPEGLETKLGQVTEGLGEAFDSTAMALGLTMLTMFLTYLVERLEGSLYEQVDTFAEEQLAHRFLRMGAESQPLVAAVQHGSQQLLHSTEQLVKQQARIWAETLAVVEQRSAQEQQQQQQQLAAALGIALERTLKVHARQLEEMQQQVSPLAQHLAALGETIRSAGQDQQQQTQALANLLDQGKHLVHLQGLLHENLSALAGAGVFEQAVQSLTAAIHMLTARTSGSSSAPTNPPSALKLSRPGPGSGTGKAA